MNTDKGRLIDETSDLDAGVAEVEHQAKRKPGCTEIIDALGIVSVGQYSYRFQLHHDAGLNEKINRILPYHSPFVVHDNPELLLDHQSRVAQFKGQGVFINLLQKSGAERIADLKRAPNDAFRYSIDSEIICFHLRILALLHPPPALPRQHQLPPKWLRSDE